MKIVSQLDASGLLIGPAEADESPLEPGVFLLPGGCVDLPPIEAPIGMRARFVEGRFVLESVPASAPPEPISAAEVVANIKAERDRRTQSGGYKVGANWFHSDTFSRTQQMGLVMLGAALPAGIEWKTLDGTKVKMTQALAQQIFAAAAASDIAVFAAAELHIAAVLSSPAPSTYDFSGGWPPVFGE